MRNDLITTMKLWLFIFTLSLQTVTETVTVGIILEPTAGWLSEMSLRDRRRKEERRFEKRNDGKRTAEKILNTGKQNEGSSLEENGIRKHPRRVPRNERQRETRNQRRDRSEGPDHRNTKNNRPTPTTPKSSMTTESVNETQMTAVKERPDLPTLVWSESEETTQTGVRKSIPKINLDPDGLTASGERLNAQLFGMMFMLALLTVQ